MHLERYDSFLFPTSISEEVVNYEKDTDWILSNSGAQVVSGTLNVIEYIPLHLKPDPVRERGNKSVQAFL